MNNKTLNLIVTTHWFNMIDSGFKQEEYRKIKPYWTTRFLSGEYWGMPPENFKAGQYETKYPFSHVLIRSAYTSIFTIFEFEGIFIKKPNPLWCGDDFDVSKNVFSIKLGRRM